MNKLVVLMSVYHGDRLDFVLQSFTSLIKQQYAEFDIYIQFDGCIDPLVEEYLLSITDDRLHISMRPENRGLAYSLNELIDRALLAPEQYSYFARMDADDVCSLDRFLKQVQFLELNCCIDVVGSWCEEIDEENNSLFYKKLVTDDYSLKTNIVKRCPFIHPSVVFRRKIFEQGHRYNTNIHLTEDYYFWVDLASHGYLFANIPEYLIKYRINKNFYQRRCGYKKAIAETKSKFYAINVLNHKSVSNYLYAFATFFLRICPQSVARWIYSKFRPV